MRLNLLEYILLDYFSAHTKKKEDFTSDRLYRHKGLMWADPIVMACLESIKEKMLISINSEGSFQLLPKWTKLFATAEDFDNKDETNLGFWQFYGKIGNKELARKAYFNARKVVSKEVLHEAAKKYIQNCKDCGRFELHASTYLNPTNRHWEDELPEPQKKKEPVKEESRPKFKRV